MRSIASSRAHHYNHCYNFYKWRDSSTNETIFFLSFFSRIELPRRDITLSISLMCFSTFMHHPLSARSEILHRTTKCRYLRNKGEASGHGVYTRSVLSEWQVMPILTVPVAVDSSLWPETKRKQHWGNATRNN